MRTFKIMVVIMTAAICSYAAAQRPRMESFPEGSYSPVTNINRNSYPRVLADGSVMFHFTKVINVFSIGLSFFYFCCYFNERRICCYRVRQNF